MRIRTKSVEESGRGQCSGDSQQDESCNEEECSGHGDYDTEYESNQNPSFIKNDAKPFTKDEYKLATANIGMSEKIRPTENVRYFLKKYM